LKRLATDLIGKEQWMTLEVDVKGDAYEGLLEKNAADESLEDSANLPDPDVIAAEIAEDLQAALDQFSLIAADLKPSPKSP
jgi:hypothetical protein